MRKIKALAILLTLGLILVACQATDVIGKFAISSFQTLVESVPDQISGVTNYWVLESPAGDQFKWSKDFSGANPDAVVEFDAAPFINAGLNVEQLPQDNFKYDQATNRLVMPYEFGQDKFIYSGKSTALDTFKKIVETHRPSIDYHVALDHYGIVLGNGNAFEWAKDMAKNDKDIVFVLNPQPFIEAGVAPEKIEGWIFAKVEIMNKQGQKELVDKILRPFNLD